jgi:hypothetical protein
MLRPAGLYLKRYLTGGGAVSIHDHYFGAAPNRPAVGLLEPVFFSLRPDPP